jgi:adenosylmethionine-8-amino-7-oxononanoate aminotransferase
LLSEALFAPSPDSYLAQPGESAEDCAGRAADALAELFDRHHGEICAMIVEPRVQCAGGMRMHHPSYLARVRELCDAHGVFLIADEIAVGFGRTGPMFASQESGVMPDLMCLSKGLTGGFLPLAAVLATQEIYDAFLDDSRERAFLHSHSYTGNPLACAAALATLDIFESDDVLARNRNTAITMGEYAKEFASHAQVADVRQAGMILAFELTRDGDKRTPFPPQQRVGLKAYRAALANGVVLRPLGDVLYWMPPYCVDDEQLRLLSKVTRIAIDEATA